LKASSTSHDAEEVAKVLRLRLDLEVVDQRDGEGEDADPVLGEHALARVEEVAVDEPGTERADQPEVHLHVVECEVEHLQCDKRRQRAEQEQVAPLARQGIQCQRHVAALAQAAHADTAFFAVVRVKMRDSTLRSSSW
jgi:hypothetical protein